DDMRTDELQYMPNVQKLIGDEGVTFTNGFASLPLCCPARASVFTGQFPHNHGVWSQKPPFAFASMDDRETFPVWMHRAGYRNSYIGKYLNRFGRDPAPGRTKGNSLQYVPPGWDNFRPTLDGLTPNTKYWGGTHQYFNTTLGDNGHGFISNRGTYQTIAYTRLEKQNLRRDLKQKKPFFHFVSFSAPHVGGPHEDDDPKDLGTPGRPRPVRGLFDDIITEPPGADWHDPDRSDKPHSMRSTLTDDDREQILESARQRAESLYLVDRSVGRMISTLKKHHQLANTTVVFTSDNGYFLGEQGKPQGKTLPYEPSLRVPVLMRGPGIPRGEIRTDPFLSVDFAPTFADIADGRRGHKGDGKSMLDVMRLGDETADDSWSRRVPTETVPTKAVIQKVSRRDPIGARPKQQLRGRVIGLRTHRYLYTEWAREPWDWEPGVDRELYDVLKDPEQYDNLAVDPKHKKLVAQFHKLVGRSHTCAGASCRVPLPENLR
ncbi:MAG: sulfatase, partial [Nocardioides sp.]|nr:sulfatase [Nocardioides sp.]